VVNKTYVEPMKKMTQWLALSSITALCLTGTVIAQEQGQGGPGGNRGGGRGQGGAGGGDPAEFRAQFEQRMMETIRERLEIKEDAEWTAIEPLIKKVTEVRAQQIGGNMRGLGRGNRGGQGGQGGGQGGGGGRGGFGGEPSAEQTALTEAVENPSASKDELKAKMAEFRKARDQKAAELKTAQDNLKKVLTTKQEAVALQMSLVN
jgi:hypothetical protein